MLSYIGEFNILLSHLRPVSIIMMIIISVHTTNIYRYISYIILYVKGPLVYNTYFQNCSLLKFVVHC